MTKKDFIEKYQSAFIMEFKDDDSEIKIIGSQNVGFMDAVTIYFEEDFCNIYQEFTYEDYYDLFTIRAITREKLLLMQALGKSYGILP